MNIRQINRNQYGIEHAGQHFVCSLVGGRWEVYSQTEGFATVHRGRKGQGIDDVQAWLETEYPEL